MTLIIDSGYTWDTDALNYVNAVKAADAAAGQTGGLESGVEDAIDAFVKGCKADGIWHAIKASCILAGARTLQGALVPLVGTAPTNINFVSGNYNRKTGLVGDGTTKSLNTNRAGSADGQNNIHVAVYASTLDSLSGRYLSGSTVSPTIAIIGNTTGFRTRVQSSTLYTVGSGTAVPSIIAVSRSSSANFNWRFGSQSGSQSDTSVGISPTNYCVFSGNGPDNYTTARLSFYSIGESLDLALLDARVTALMSAFAAAIP